MQIILIKSKIHDNNIAIFPHPANSPDLNPIEMVWTIMKQKLIQNGDIRY